MYTKISELKAVIKQQGIKHYKNSSFEYKYLTFNIEKNTISNSVSDASIDLYRS